MNDQGRNFAGLYIVRFHGVEEMRGRASGRTGRPQVQQRAIDMTVGAGIERRLATKTRTDKETLGSDDSSRADS